MKNALLIELVKRGHRAEQQKSFSVHYDGHFIGKMTPDLIVDNLVIIDPKVVEEFNQDHFAQMLGYLPITGLELAILINFKHASLRWKRIINSGAERNGEINPMNSRIPEESALICEIRGLYCSAQRR